MSQISRKSFRTVFSIILLALIVSLATPALGANLTGTVRDPSQATLPGATVHLRNLDSGLEKSTRTSASGMFSFDSLSAGRYRIRVLAPGFLSATRDTVDLPAFGTLQLDFNLSILPPRTSIEVMEQSSDGAQDALALARTHDSDVSASLRNAPGYAAIASGGLSGLPALRGLADDRVNILLNGMTIGQACSNHMNPPLSYVAPAAAPAPLIAPGVTPVSLGGDSTAGTIAVNTPAPDFLTRGQGLRAHGGLSLFHHTNSISNGGNAWFALSSPNATLSYTGSYVNANNYHDGLGAAVKSTFYESQNHNLQLGARKGSNQFQLGLGYQRIPQQGFPNARMDMTRNEAKFLNLAYARLLGSARLDARFYYQDTRHEMNILRDKIPGMNMPMETSGVNSGYTLSLEKNIAARHTIRLGQEMRRFSLNDWWPPVTNMVGSMGPATLWNVSEGRRNRIAAYGEWEARQSSHWTTLLGIRAESVGMNAGDVVGYNTSTTTTGSAMYAADAAEFNALPRARRDFNFDASAAARWQPRAGWQAEFGFARKTRSPGIYERYLWVKRSMMSVNMNGWFGDGNGYTGNIQLNPEAAHHFTAASEWRGTGENAWRFRLAPFLTEISDFIDVRRCPVINDKSNGCTPMTLNATSGFTTLQFKRKLVACDVDDLSISGTSRVLFAFGRTKPENGVPSQHMSTDRIQKNIDLVKIGRAHV